MISMKYRSFITIISTLLVLFVGQSAFAQQQKPKWTEGFFEEGTNTYLQCIDASGYDHNDARTKAVNKIYENRNLAASTDVSVTITDNNVQVAGKKDLMVKEFSVLDSGTDGNLRLGGGRIVCDSPAP